MQEFHGDMNEINQETGKCMNVKKKLYENEQKLLFNHPNLHLVRYCQCINKI